VQDDIDAKKKNTYDKKQSTAYRKPAGICIPKHASNHKQR
jgi:hypothetical protein